MISDLFDTSFETFVGLRVVRFVYLLAVIFFTITAAGLLGFGILAISRDALGPLSTEIGVGMIVAAPLWLFFSLLTTRVVLELVAVQFRNAECLKRIAERS